MKKVFDFLLILGVSLQAVAEIKFGGDVNTGIGVMTGSEDYMPQDTTAVLSAQGADSGTPFRLRLNGEYQNEEEFLGANIQLLLEANKDPSPLGLGWAYGWIKGFKGKFVSYAGYIDNTDFEYLADPFDEDTDEGLGLMTIVSPIANLKIGAAAYVAPSVEDLPSMQYADFDITKAKYSLNASFELPEKLRFVAAWSPGIDNWDELAQGNGGVWGADDNTGKLMAGLTFTGINKLTLLGGVTMWNLLGGTLNEYQDGFGILRFEVGAIFETGLGKGDFTAALVSRILLPQGDMFKTGQANLAQAGVPPFGEDLGYYINASFAYAMIPFVPRLDLEFAQGAVPEGLAGSYKYGKGLTYYSGGAFDPSFNNTDIAFTVRPYIQIHLAKGTSFEFGDYLCIMDLPTAGLLFGNPQMNTKGIMNAVYVDFKWSF
jgi:hypothetical protein